MPLDDLGQAAKDTSRSCVFDFPDRPIRPQPPINHNGEIPPDWPYEINVDWQPPATPPVPGIDPIPGSNPWPYPPPNPDPDWDGPWRYGEVSAYFPWYWNQHGGVINLWLRHSVWSAYLPFMGPWTPQQQQMELDPRGLPHTGATVPGGAFLYMARTFRKNQQNGVQFAFFKYPPNGTLSPTSIGVSGPAAGPVENVEVQFTAAFWPWWEENPPNGTTLTTAGFRVYDLTLGFIVTPAY